MYSPLYGLGANVSVISYAIYKRLLLRSLKPTRYLLQLANGAVEHARGVTKNIMIKVGKFFFISMNFVVVDQDENEPETHVILGRPFLATSGALIDVLEGTITLRVGEEKVAHDVLKWNHQVNTRTKPP